MLTSCLTTWFSVLDVERYPYWDEPTLAAQGERPDAFSLITTLQLHRFSLMCKSDIDCLKFNKCLCIVQDPFLYTPWWSGLKETASLGWHVGQHYKAHEAGRSTAKISFLFLLISTVVSNEENTFKKVKLAGPHCVNGLLSALKSIAFYLFLGIQSSGRLEFISGIVLH